MEPQRWQGEPRSGSYPQCPGENVQEAALQLQYFLHNPSDDEENEVIAAMKACPAVTHARNGFGQYPLHSLREGIRGTFAQALVNECPEAASTPDLNGDYPLHSALGNSADHSVIKVLIAAHPEAVKIADRFGRLPLYLATLQHSSEPERVLRILLDSYPEAANVKTLQGDWPLHSALRAQLPSTSVRLLFDACTEAAQQKDDNGKLPLHLAVRREHDEDLIRDLMNGVGDALSMPDAGGELPLHIAIRHNCLRTVRCLARQDSRCLTLQDARGLRPIQCASTPSMCEHLFATAFDLGCLHELCGVDGLLAASARFADLGTMRGFAPAVQLGASALPHYRRACDELRAAGDQDDRLGVWAPTVRHADREEVLRVLRLWHAASRLWRSFLDRTFAQVLCASAAEKTASFLYGEC